MLIPILLASIAAGALIVLAAALLAIGACFRHIREESPFFDSAAAIIVGSAAASLGYLAFASSGIAVVGAMAVSCALIFVTVVRRRLIGNAAILSANRLQLIWPESRFERVAVLVVALTLLVYAIAPPRDADVLRYHLAHIRQISIDRSWQWIPDVTFALPFAWSLNYLPFEVAGFPQGAGLLNVCLWFVAFLLLLEATSRRIGNRTALLISLCFMAHPYVVKVFSAGFADGFAILITATIGAALIRLPELSRRDLAVLGFVCWIGIASRYQMLAVSIASSAIVLLYLATGRHWKRAGAFLGGALVAVLASSPFYLMNWRHTGNPFWPLSTPFSGPRDSFVQQMGAGFSSQFTWPAGETIAHAVMRLLTAPYLAPLPIALVLLSIGNLFVKDKSAQRLGFLGCGFLAAWLAMSPRLYPTHILPLVGIGPLLVVGLLPRVENRDNPSRLTTPLRVISGVFITLSLVFSWDYARYDLTGNSNEYHRFTWYHPVYEWVNRNTPRDSKFLVIVFSGVSYYLERPNRRADPWLSAEIDWARVASPAALDSIMQQGGFDYLIFDDRYWYQYSGGKQMSDVVHLAVSNKTLIPVYHSREKLYSGRVRREYTESDVYVYRRATAR